MAKDTKKIRRNKQKAYDSMMRPFDDLDSIIREATPIVESSEETRTSLNNFLESMKDKGAPVNVMDTIEGIATSLRKEIDTINNSISSHETIMAEVKTTPEKSRLFDLSGESVDIGINVMTSMMNIDTIMTDLVKARSTIIDVAGADDKIVEEDISGK